MGYDMQRQFEINCCPDRDLKKIVVNRKWRENGGQMERKWRENGGKMEGK